MNSAVEIEIDGIVANIHGRAGDVYFEEMIKESHNNRFFSYVLQAQLSIDPVIFDVGANIGLTTVMASRRAGVVGSVHAFEPGPEAYEHLSLTVSSNNLKNVIMHQIAIGSVNGLMRFQEDSTSSASHLVVDGVSLGQSTRSVPVRRLDDVVSELGLTRLDLIKIDVEGHELSVLDGAVGTIRKFNPIIFMEFNSWTLSIYGNQFPRAVIERLRRDFARVIYHGDHGLKTIETDADMVDFLAMNMLNHGCVDDLLLFPHPGAYSPAS